MQGCRESETEGQKYLEKRKKNIVREKQILLREKIDREEKCKY